MPGHDSAEMIQSQDLSSSNIDTLCIQYTNRLERWKLEAKRLLPTTIEVEVSYMDGDCPFIDKRDCIKRDWDLSNVTGTSLIFFADCRQSTMGRPILFPLGSVQSKGLIVMTTKNPLSKCPHKNLTR